MQDPEVQMSHVPDLILTHFRVRLNTHLLAGHRSIAAARSPSFGGEESFSTHSTYDKFEELDQLLLGSVQHL